MSMNDTDANSEAEDFRVQDSLPVLLNWCTNKGVELHSVEVLSRDGQRGLYAKTDINAGDCIVSIPRQSAIIANIADESPPNFYELGGLSKEFWQSAAWEARLAVVLLDECARGKDSPFYEYIMTLPRDPWCALWAFEKLGGALVSKQLQPYHMHSVAREYRDHVKHTLVLLRKALPKAKHSLVTLERYSWAIAICQSRGFGIPVVGTIANHNRFTKGSSPSHFQKRDEVVPIRYALFPGLDMANHSVHCQTSFKYDADADIHRVHTGTNFAAGEQVFLSYGSKSNDDLMFFYSFVEGNNPANTVKLPDFREWILDLGHEYSQKDSDWDAKLEVLQKNHLTQPAKSHVFELDKVPDELMLAVRIAVASNEDLSKLKKDIEEQPDCRHKPVGLNNELNAWHAIDVKCQALLAEAGDFTEDQQESLTKMFSKRPCSAVWRWGEEGSDGEVMYKYERQTVLSVTSDRVRHFARISSAVGRVCTVLMPPSQSLLKADLFTGMDDTETSGVFKFAIPPDDINLTS